MTQETAYTTDLLRRFADVAPILDDDDGVPSDAVAEAPAATTIERFDFSQPPAGYHVGAGNQSKGFGWRNGEREEWHYITDAGALAHAWSDYKAHNDPPGLLLWVAALLAAQTLPSDESGIRAAAWAWYERRIALASRLERTCDAAHLQVLLPHLHAGRLWWPRILTWTDEQVAEVERWLVDSTAEMPEVLRG